VPACQSPVFAAVEGPLDAAVARKLIELAGATVGTIYVRGGKRALLRRAAAYNNAARFSPWLVLVDLDADKACPPGARDKWLRGPASLMCFRVVVREIEAWLMADRVSFARFLRVPVGRVPLRAESLADPKHEVIRLARGSRSRVIQADLVPGPSSGRRVGPAYTSRMIEFVQQGWSTERAAGSAESLARALRALRTIVQAGASRARSRANQRDREGN